MALYQPTNVIPSSFTDGTVDVNDNMQLSWQVNGNSAMTAFQIDFYLNDYASTPIKSTGRLTDGCPFYGLDRFGNVEFFTWSNTLTWAQFTRTSTIKFSNGNNYKYKIIQWYKADENVVSATPTDNLAAGTIYYFALPESGYVQFAPSQNCPAGSTKFYYNIGKRKAWSVSNNTLQVLPMVFKDSLPDGESAIANMTTDSVASAEDFVVQTSFSVFITRKQPTVTLYLTNKNFQNPTLLPSDLGTSIGYFQAMYEQEQDDPIRWVRWQVATASNEEVGEIIADTGDIYTPTLNYEYNGFFNGGQYAIRCIGKSESGQLTVNKNANDDGWQFITINIINQGKYTGNIKVKCLNSENAALVEWDNIDKIKGVAQGGYVQNDDSVILSNGASITWDNLLGAPMNFNPPWTVAWRGKLIGAKPETTVTFSGNAETPLNNPLRHDFEGQATTGNVADTQGRYTSGEILVAILPSYGIRETLSSITLDNESGEGTVTYSSSLKDNYTLSITLYSTLPNTQIKYSFFATFYPTYYLEQTFNIPAPIQSYEVLSGGASNYEISYNNDEIKGILYSRTPAQISLSINVLYDIITSSPQGKLFTITMANGEINISREGDNVQIEIIENGATILTENIAVNSYSIIGTILISEERIQVLFHTKFTIPPNDYEYVVESVNLQYVQSPITKIEINGGNPNSTIYSFAVYDGSNSEWEDNYKDVNFKPAPNSTAYSLYMAANMQNSIDGIAGSAVGTGFRVYRQEYGKNVLFPVATLSNTISQFKDFGLVSRKVYQYSVYAYDGREAFMTSATSELIATSFKNYSLLVCDYDQEKDEYHVRKQYIFALNLSVGSVGNNNSPTLNANFTRYPTRMPSTQNYASGTLQGLIGAIYTVPALIEQIGNYKWTAKPSTMDYFDNVDLEKELYDLSTAPYQLFLRDMKGRLRMIATNSAITMTTDIKQKQQSISISFPWVEIGDASDVTIIQTPQDYGWNNDNQLLEVSLDVNSETGELSAAYPFPYNGTRFYLTGVNQEILAAKTPLGVTPAQFELSNVAVQPSDGELNSTIQTNSEVTK